MRAEERRREGCRKKKLKLPGVHFSHPSSRQGLQTTTSAHREWGGASQDWHLTPARGCHRSGNCAETPHICFSIGATILRSEESVAKATSLLGRTLRRASHAESERAWVRACLPACARVRQPSRSGHGSHTAAAAAAAATEAAAAASSHTTTRRQRSPRRAEAEPRLATWLRRRRSSHEGGFIEDLSTTSQKKRSKKPEQPRPPGVPHRWHFPAVRTTKTPRTRTRTRGVSLKRR